MNATIAEPTTKETKPEVPEWLAKWKTGQQTLEIFRKVRPRFHETTLGRMRQRGEIEATKFAGKWYYLPESALPKPDGK